MGKSYLEKLKTEFVTDPKLKQPTTERTRYLRNSLFGFTPKVCSERARLYTESWKETEGQPIVVRRAKALEHILGEMSIFIRSGELVVGNFASDLRAAPVAPEYSMQFILEELDGKPYRFEKRPGTQFRVDEEDERILREVGKWWRGKTMAEYKVNLLPEEAYKAHYEVQALNIDYWGEGNGSGHFIVNYPKVLNRGIYSMVTDAEDRIEDLKLWVPEDLERKSFLEAVSIVLRAATSFAKRYTALAKEMGDKETDSKRKAELVKIAEHCEWVPANPARTFWEALQSLWFAHLIVQIESCAVGIGLGRLDQFMYPFYKQAIQDRRVTVEEVAELLECFWIKTAEINKVKSWAATRVHAGYPLFQQMTVGGQTRDERSAVNDLSWLALEVTENLKLVQPSMAARWWNECPEDFLLKCCECINIHRGGMPQMHNDEVIIPSQMGVGISMEDSYNYAIDGCISPAMPGNSWREGYSDHFNMHKAFELTLCNGVDPRTRIQLRSNPRNKDLTTFESFDELMNAVKYQMEYYNRQAFIAQTCTARAYAELTPIPFASALMDDCIQRGKDIQGGGAHYFNTTYIEAVGIANVGNSLAAIKKLVFDDEKLTGAQIMHALETNFEDNATTPTGPEIRHMLLAAPKYGNDDDYVDLLTKEVNDHTARDARSYRWPGGTGGYSVISVSINVPFGEVIGATPDGRKSGIPVADGCSPVRGTDIRGPTAVLKSVAKLGHMLGDGGMLLNQKFNPIVCKDISGLRKLASLIKTYFDLKGQHLQFNVVSVDTLREAQKRPEEYKDLMVRVAGYSALFTSLDPTVQEDIILRTEHTI